MVEFIRQYMKDISIYLIFDAFIGIILPNSKYKKYIGLVSGAVLILILTGHIKQFDSVDILLDDANFDMQVNSYDDVKNKMIRQEIATIVKKQISQIVQQSYCFKLSDVYVESDLENILSLSVYLEGADENADCLAEIDSLKNKIVSLYNLSTDNVNVHYKR